MIVEFYGIIHVMEEVKKMKFTNVCFNVILSWFGLRLRLRLMFIGCFVINGILILITVRKLGLELLIFFFS